MKTIATVFAAALLAAVPAAAQPQHQPHSGGGAPHPAMHAPSSAMHAHVSTMHAMHPAVHAHVASHHATMHHHVTARHVARHAAHARHVAHHHIIHHAVRAAVRPAFHRAPAAVVAKFRRNVVAVHRFHAGPYGAPPGWHYQRWVFGERLPAIYFAPAFWISDFLAFDLLAPPDGYVWVRYGPDALLIDQYSGEIIQVDYGVFY